MTAGLLAGAVVLLVLAAAVVHLLQRVADEVSLLRIEVGRWYELRPAVVEVRADVAALLERRRAAARR